jgi:ribonuclease PH
MLETRPKLSQIAAVSVGVREGENLLDLCYEEDSSADFDLNLVFNDRGEVVEIQGTAEGLTLTPQVVHELTLLAWDGARDILEIQKTAS